MRLILESLWYICIACRTLCVAKKCDINTWHSLQPCEVLMSNNHTTWSGAVSLITSMDSLQSQHGWVIIRTINVGLFYIYSPTFLRYNHWSLEVISSHILLSEGLLIHDDVIKWKHFPRYWPFVRVIHRSPVNSPHKGQWRGALMFSVICVWINSWVNSGEAGDLRRYRAHCDVTVMHVGIKVNPYQ